MLENLEYPRLLDKSDKVLGAENQQERLITLGWVLGFVDGEGCFSIGFVKQPDRGKRKGYKIGYQVYHEFAVTQGAKSLETLHQLRVFYGVGAVYPNRRHDNHKENLYRYVVRNREDVMEVIIPFFRQNPLRTSKQRDFEKWAQCAEWMKQGKHLTQEGLIEIAQLAETMNRQKPRHDLIGILRDYTPTILEKG